MDSAITKRVYEKPGLVKSPVSLQRVTATVTKITAPRTEM